MICRLWRRMASAIAAACLVGAAGCDKLLEPPGAPPPPPRETSETRDTDPLFPPYGQPPTELPDNGEQGADTPVEPDSDISTPSGDAGGDAVADDAPVTPGPGGDPVAPPEGASDSDATQTDHNTPPSVEEPDPQPDPQDDGEVGETPPPAGGDTADNDDGVTPAFLYYPPGNLAQNSGSGVGDATVYVPDMVFPIKDARAYPQSQVYRYGGYILGGDQCDPRNFTAPWRDNYCEKRSTQNSTPYCPASRVHLGQDIRVGTPEGCRAEVRTPAAQRKRYAVVAAADGVISNVGRYTVNLRAGGRIYRYMHMNMQALEVGLGQTVEAGDVLGYVSNDFGGAATTLHLHFEIKHNTAEHGWTWAPPYTSLVKAYERREGALGRLYTES